MEQFLFPQEGTRMESCRMNSHMSEFAFFPQKNYLLHIQPVSFFVAASCMRFEVSSSIESYIMH